MTDRPILFSAPMVRGLIREVERPGTGKTQTRRTLKLPKWSTGNADHVELDDDGSPLAIAKETGCLASIPLRFRKGDRLWVREAWRCNGWASDVATIFYRASEGDGYTAMCEQWPVADHKPLRVETRWSPSLHMPRWASRLTLTVTDVRVQRLQEISEADAIAEGAGQAYGEPCHSDSALTDRRRFELLWTSINGAGTWDANPWIVALTFTVERRNIDAPRAA